MKNFRLDLSGILRLPGSDHRVPRVSLRSFRFRWRSKEASRLYSCTEQRLLSHRLRRRIHGECASADLRDLLSNPQLHHHRVKSLQLATRWFDLLFSMLADKLNMGAEEAERWIVNLIRNASLDAKIDSQQGTVVMGTQALSPYQIIIEKTKNLFNRTQTLAQNSEKKRDTNVSLSLVVRFPAESTF